MAVFGEAARQTPRQEDRTSNQMEMGQSANVESGHTKESGFGADCLKPTWPIGNRPQVSNLPHKTDTPTWPIGNRPQVSNLPRKTERRIT